MRFRIMMAMFTMATGLFFVFTIQSILSFGPFR